MMKRSVVVRLVFAALFAAGAAAFAGDGVALVPAGLTQQGRLLDNAGQPVNGLVSFTFSIYEDAEGGDALWSEEQEITLDEGYFSARLGDEGANAFPAELFSGNVRYLGIRVGSDPEMTPRQRIASVPYAFLADRAEVATNVTGAITPTSVSVGGVDVIDTAGKLHGFRSMVTQVNSMPVAVEPGSVGTAQASCPENHVLVGGGCYITSAGTGRIKQSSPDVGFDEGGTDPSRNWECTVEADAGAVAAAEANAVAICLPD
jgi:hypothetical protein